MRLTEYNYKQLATKQKSIGKLFDPARFQARLDAVQSNGGVKLKDKRLGVWTFEVASGTKPGIKYSVPISFVDIDEMLIKYVPGSLKTDGSGVDYTELALEVLNHVSIETDCSCPADTYYGGEYIKTKRGAQYGDQEDRSPDIRNPKQYGIVCKHGHKVWEILPAMVGDFADYLEEFYGDTIESLARTHKQEVGAFKRAGEYLGTKEEPTTFGRGGKPVKTPAKEPEKEEEIDRTKDLEDQKKEIEKLIEPIKQKRVSTLKSEPENKEEEKKNKEIDRLQDQLTKTKDLDAQQELINKIKALF